MDVNWRCIREECTLEGLAMKHTERVVRWPAELYKRAGGIWPLRAGIRVERCDRGVGRKDR